MQEINNMKQAREVTLNDIEKWKLWANQISSLRSSTVEEVSSLVNRKTNQKKIALDFFLNPDNQEREFSKKELMETFSCESIEVRNLINYVNTQVSHWRILKNRKGGYIYHLKAVKKSLLSKNNREIKVSLPERVYNFLKQNIGIWFSKKQILAHIYSNESLSLQTIIRQKYIQKYCLDWEIIWFFQSWGPETGQYILWSQEQVNEWVKNLQDQTSFKGDKKVVYHILQNLWKELSVQEFMELLWYKKSTALLNILRHIQNKFFIKDSFYSGSWIKVPMLTKSQVDSMELYLSSH
jgi:hypothetical protein